MYRPATKLSCAVCLPLIAMGSYAQTDAQNPVPTALEEVVVTAQKREQTLQDVPISISVATAQDMADINAFTFDDLVQLTPGVSLFGGLQSASIRLRGVGPGYFAVNSPQSVVVFVDQFAQAQVGTAFSTLVDLERLELLRGPQGTLYGINAPGGAYNIITRAPNFDGINGYVEGSYSQYEKSSQLAAEDMRGAVNVPLIDDTLALRLAGVYRNDNGYIKNVNPASSDDSNGGANTKAIRARTRWEMNDRMRLDTTANYQDLSQQISSFAYQGLLPGTGGDTGNPPIYTKFKDREDYGDYAGGVDGDVKDISAHWSWDADFSDVDFLAMHQQFTNKSNENRKPFPGSNEVFAIDLDYKITSYELRFSDVIGDLSYVTGLYHFDRPADGQFHVLLSGVEVLGDSTGKDTGSAGYGNVSYKFTEKWELGLGARYDDIHTELDNDIRFLDYVALIDDDLNFDHVSWSVKLSHYFNDNLTFYAAVDNAFKQGGFNPLVPAVIPLEQFLPEVSAAGREYLLYDDETSISYEVGVKGIALDDRLRFSADIFYQTFQDHQIGMPGDVVALDPLSGLFNNQLANADEIYTQGVEFDVTYLFSENWEAALRGAYSDPTIDTWDTRLCAAGEEPPLQPGQTPIPNQLYCPKNGEPLNELPRWQTNFQLGYEHPLAGNWDVAARLNWTWQSKPVRQILAETNKPNVPDVSEFDEPKSRIDFSVSMLEQDLGLELKLWVKNITDEDLNIDPKQFEDTQTLEGRHYPGREFGMTAVYTFDNG
jgi:iron complex outermembrane receptor protein